MKNSELDRFKSMLAHRWIVILAVCALGFASLPFVAHYIPAYKAEADLLIVSNVSKDTTLSDPDLPTVIASNEVLTRVISKLHLDTDPTALAKKIKTKLPAKSSIIEVSYKDADGPHAARIANAVADEAVSYFHQIATQGYSDILSALKAQVATSKAAIAVADRRLQNASAQGTFASSDKALDDLSSQVNDLQVQRGQLNATLAADQATAAQLRKQMRDISPIVRGEILKNDVIYQQVQSSVAKDTANLISQRASFREKFPGLAALATRVHSEKDQANAVVSEAIKNGSGESASYTQTVMDSEHADGAVAADQQRLRATDAEIGAEQSHIREVAGAGARVGTLRAERDTELQEYVSLTQRLSSARGDAAQAASLGSLVVVSRAVPGPSLLWAYLLAIGIAIVVLAVIAALIVDALDRRFWGVREIHSIYGRPVLAKVGSHA